MAFTNYASACAIDAMQNGVGHMMAKCTSDSDSWYDTGSAGGSEPGGSEGAEIGLDERTGIWTGDNN